MGAVCGNQTKPRNNLQLPATLEHEAIKQEEPGPRTGSEQKAFTTDAALNDLKSEITTEWQKPQPKEDQLLGLKGLQDDQIAANLSTPKRGTKQTPTGSSLMEAVDSSLNRVNCQTSGHWSGNQP